MSTVSLTLEEIFELAKKTLLANGCDDETASILSDLIRNAERDGSVSHGSKNFEEFISNEIKMDHVITVCNNANNEVCPIWPDKNQIIHWDIDDPVTKLQNANDEEKQIIIRNTFNIISNEIKDWLDEK